LSFYTAPKLFSTSFALAYPQDTNSPLYIHPVNIPLHNIIIFSYYDNQTPLIAPLFLKKRLCGIIYSSRMPEDYERY
jgi:hypothetical protein